MALYVQPIVCSQARARRRYPSCAPPVPPSRPRALPRIRASACGSPCCRYWWVPWLALRCTILKKTAEVARQQWWRLHKMQRGPQEKNRVIKHQEANMVDEIARRISFKVPAEKLPE